MSDSEPSYLDGFEARRETQTELSRLERLYDRVDQKLPYIMIAPVFIIVVGLMLYPAVWAFKLSLYDVPISNLDNQVFVGFQNYVEILMNSFFYKVMKNSVVFVSASVVGQVGIGVTLAVLLDRGWLDDRLARFFRATYILPWATTAVIVGYSWQFLLNPRVGLVNQFLRALGWANPPPWLTSVQWAIVGLIIMNIWRGTPFSMIFQTSGLQSIQESFYEAARVGGASRLQTVRNVTLPLLRPFILMNLILVTLFTFNVFGMILVMTGGGPLDATNVLALHMYQTAFSLGNFGKASALAVLLFLFNLLTVAFYLRVFGGVDQAI
ncbi:carbohydrate ABC transporter permease [Halorhabdus amylolytica]|uniref:carbohydrate ABC transporter permease n=1 Tax=Halorhabdus amylolytica TaxID=2559573 RepID=UPI0010AAF8F7|nr:sugar ABC transporter permease [Halorhabdus amylolytica]